MPRDALTGGRKLRDTMAMSKLPTNPASSDASNNDHESANAGSKSPLSDDLGPADRVQWFGRPDPGETPLGFWRLVIITLSGHIGVRPRAKRHEDFRRANGLHVFITAIAYFALVVAALIALTNFIAR
jgi:hypothetical protein